MARDNFSRHVIKNLAARVGYKCSICGIDTMGPQRGGIGVVNLGEAAHITAASQGGPRYDERMTIEERKSFDNGIWLCKKCAKEIDNDPNYYTVEFLHKIKYEAEQEQLKRLNNFYLHKVDKQLLNDLYSSFRHLENSRKFFLEYYEKNFEQLFSYDETNEIISRYWNALYKELQYYVKAQNEELSKLRTLLYDNSVELDDVFFNALSDYIDSFRFSYEDDGIGLYNNYYGEFFRMIIDSNKKQKKRAKNIEQWFAKIKNQYNFNH